MQIHYGWVPPRSTKQPKRDKTFKPMTKPLFSNNPRMEQHNQLQSTLPSVSTGVGVALKNQKAKYDDPQLAERDAEARKVTHTIAPICNKGGYQVITAEEDLKTMGRKV